MDELKRVVEEVGQLQSDPQMINRIIEIITRFHNMPEDNELDIMALPAPCLREIQRFLGGYRDNLNYRPLVVIEILCFKIL